MIDVCGWVVDRSYFVVNWSRLEDFKGSVDLRRMYDCQVRSSMAAEDRSRPRGVIQLRDMRGLYLIF